MLTTDDFSQFYREVHGYNPFPWQLRLAKSVVADGAWPGLLDLPTAAGKTSAIDVAVFRLAVEADRGPCRKAPVRIAFVVDRRLVVDDVYAHARKLRDALNHPNGPVSEAVATRLKLLSAHGTALEVARLRGGMPRESEWARTPAQPTVLCSTVDQVGSRLLFRGYGISDRMKPVHAGLLGADCHIFLDEAHLSEPFRQTLDWIAYYHSENWKTQQEGLAAWGYTLLSATPGEGEVAGEGEVFRLHKEDFENEVFSRRWQVSKPARLVQLTKPPRRTGRSARENEDRPAASGAELAQRTDAFLAEVKKALEHLRNAGVPAPAVGIVLNRVARARAVFDALRSAYKSDEVDVTLLIGPSRPVQRDETVERDLASVKTRNWSSDPPRDLQKPLLVVATQCIEVGVDVDFDALVTDAASLDALRQRFGRLNRAGRSLLTFASIIASAADVQPKSADPVYGPAIGATWEYLLSNAERMAEHEPPRIDFGLQAFDETMCQAPPPEDTLTPRSDAPVLMPAHLDLLSQTSPVPSSDPEIGLYLHGPHKDSASVSVIWRRDISRGLDAVRMRSLLGLVPPRATEAIELPVWAVRRWLRRQDGSEELLADVVSLEPEEQRVTRREQPVAFRWIGDEEGSEWIRPGQVRPGDTIIVPADYGGADGYGWRPESQDRVTDLADAANEPFAERSFAVRLAPGLIDESLYSQFANVLASGESGTWVDLRDRLLALNLPSDVAARLKRLDKAKHGRVTARLDIYDYDAGRPNGVIFIAPNGLLTSSPAHVLLAVTEEDALGSLAGVAVSLERHLSDVAVLAERFARAAGCNEQVVNDIRIAALLHDLGKADTRFQRVLAFDDPIGSEPSELLAKSVRSNARKGAKQVDLPPHWRHEARSVRIAEMLPQLDEAADRLLVLWLIGTHHGHGRPFFPHADNADDKTEVLNLPRPFPARVTLDAGAGPQSLAYDLDGMDWPSVYETLKNRYGLWELARMEAILRLADHRASETETSSSNGGRL